MGEGLSPAIRRLLAIGVMSKGKRKKEETVDVCSERGSIPVTL